MLCPCGRFVQPLASNGMTTVLIGGGWADASVYSPFLAAAGAEPAVACLIVDEGDGPDYFAKYEAHLATVAAARPFPVLVPVGGAFDPSALDGADALLVCGGLTPAYADALAPAAAAVREWLGGGGPPPGGSGGGGGGGPPPPGGGGGAGGGGPVGGAPGGGGGGAPPRVGGGLGGGGGGRRPAGPRGGSRPGEGGGGAGLVPVRRGRPRRPGGDAKPPLHRRRR